MVGLLDRLGVQSEFPGAQTCCGQPFFNGGFQSQARTMARNWLKVFAPTDGYIISPSGSCVDMVRHHYLELFPPGTPEHQMTREVAPRTFEFSQFLVNELKRTDIGARFPYKATYQASCHLLRGLRARDEAKTLPRIFFVPGTIAVMKAVSGNHCPDASNEPGENMMMEPLMEIMEKAKGKI